MMLPGTYLQKRRVMAAYSIRSLARDLVVADHFGQRMSFRDNVRLELHLLAAEAGDIFLSARQAETLASFVRLDPVIYRDLVDVAEGRSHHPAFRVCKSCACSDELPCHVPFSGLPGAACNWATTDLCSCCAELASSSPSGPVPLARADYFPTARSNPAVIPIRIVSFEGDR